MRRLTAIDLQQLAEEDLSWERIREGVVPEALPTREVDLPPREGSAVIVSWRWDREGPGDRSRNLALALKHARELEVDLAFVDAVAIEQRQSRSALLADVAALAGLFSTLPVIAAYDEVGVAMEQFPLTLRRPWIFSEIRAFSQNPTTVTHVGFNGSESEPRDLSFANQVSVIRSEGYAATILDIIHGRVAMTDTADFAEILAGFSEAVTACDSAFGCGDYLFSVFLLVAIYEKRQTVERDGKQVDYGFRTNVAEPRFEEMGLERFAVDTDEWHEPRPFESHTRILLDGREVAIWRSKMTTSWDRNWVEVLPGAEQCILDAIDLSPELLTAYSAAPETRRAAIQLDRDAPTPTIREQVADLASGRWLANVPLSGGRTLGFNQVLWEPRPRRNPSADPAARTS